MQIASFSHEGFAFDMEKGGASHGSVRFIIIGRI